MLSLERGVEEISIFAKRFKMALGKLNIETIKDLVFYFPLRYEDRSAIKTLKELKVAGETTARVRIVKISSRRSRSKKMVLTEAVIEDGSGRGMAIWFNRPYLLRTLPPGTEVWFSGKFKATLSGPSFISPTFELAKGEQVHTGRIVPVYPGLGSIPQKSFRRVVHQALSSLAEQAEWLPFEAINKNNLPDFNSAIGEIHFPLRWKSLNAAAKRFKFEELYLLSLRGELSRAELLLEKAPMIPIDIAVAKNFISTLPFTLTLSQKKAAWEIIQDLSRSHPMNRLLDGDVGSGKTAVAMIAGNCVAAAGGQTVIMAPTEILAKQHYANFCKFFPNKKIGTAILTRTAAEMFSGNLTRPISGRETLLRATKEGRVQILIGTHALLFEKLVFKNLALSIIDEQHRFGVEQRKALKDLRGGGISPHLLSMTATPIPRSLALAFYGDLDISILREMPKGRIPIKTMLAGVRDENKIYEKIREEVAAHHQAFVICPLVDPSDTLGVKAATAEYERLKKDIFKDIKMGLLHGRMKSVEKDAVMAAFKENKISILVSTSVVEVGVDIPNATIMLILGAERFGLSQLHQFRGRIGRGDAPSTCFVLAESASPISYRRLKVFAQTSDGFKLAEADLEFRGPGEIFGTRQSGISEFKLATLSDIDIMVAAKAAAKAQISSDRNFKTAPALAARLVQMESSIHLE